jgi:homoserine dehydrogenase
VSAVDVEVQVGVAVRTIRVGLLGFGVVGQAVARAATTESDRLAQSGVLLKCIGALVRDVERPRAAPEIRVTDTAAEFPWSDCDVIVEALGGVEPAYTLVTQALTAGIPVVTANKSLIAAHGPALRRLAAQRRVPLYFEAAVIAGVPCVHTLARRPLATGDAVFTGILNGTSHYLLSRIARGDRFDDALLRAIELGYAEPTSDNDVSGRDAAEKLAILLHLAGHESVAPTDLPRRGIDAVESWHLAIARALGGVIKPVAHAIAAPRHAWVGPAFVPNGHPCASIDGVTNALIANGVTSIGPGAGPDVTAATVIDDVVEAVVGRATALPLPATSPAGHGAWNIAPGKWFLALDHVHASPGELAEFLAARHLPAVAFAGDDSRGWRGVVTATAPVRVLLDAVDALSALGVTVTWYPVLPTSAEVTRG